MSKHGDRAHIGNDMNRAPAREAKVEFVPGSEFVEAPRQDAPRTRQAESASVGKSRQALFKAKSRTSL